MASLTTEPDGYSIQICGCSTPYVGARKLGTPDCCEVCGYITPGQFDAIRRAILGQPSHSITIVVNNPVDADVAGEAIRQALQRQANRAQQ